jgi:hypothetical protein
VLLVKKIQDKPQQDGHKMAGKIDLKAYAFPKQKTDYRSGAILRKARQNLDLAKANQTTGLVTLVILEATQVEGGYGWAISDFIEFGFTYTQMPIFTWGLDGTAGIDYSTLGDNVYSYELPGSVAALTVDDYQPAIFVPRVIHWYISNRQWLGCYLLVCQVNSECTETDKIVRIHYRFEGTGVRKSA